LKHISIFCFIFPIFKDLASQPTKFNLPNPRKSIGIQYARGFLFAHSPLMHAIGRGPNQSLEINFEIQTSGKKDWEWYHKLPLWRLLFNIADFSDPQHIGLVYSLGTEMSFPLIRSKIFYMGITGALGIGFVSKPFDPLTNNINGAVSAPINYLLRPGLEWSLKIHSHMYLLYGLKFMHWSVGALTLPNLGMNIPAFSLGIKAGWGVRNLPEENKPKFIRPKWQIDWLVCLGMKQVMPIGTGFYPTATLGIWAYKQFTPKSGLPIGLDLFYDESIKMRLFRVNHSYGYFRHTLRAGLFGGYEFVINKFSLYFHFGGYFLWPDKLDTRFYQRIGMRYRVGNRGLINFSLKSHFFVADFVELGGGFRIFRFNKKK